MTDRFERDFDKFLAGEHPINQPLDATQDDPEPPMELDLAIRQMARESVEAGKPSHRIGAHWALLSTAASLLLVGVLLWRNDPFPSTASKLDESAPSLAETREKAAPAEPQRVEPQRLEERAEISSRSRQPSESSERKRERAAPPQPAPQVEIREYVAPSAPAAPSKSMAPESVSDAMKPGLSRQTTNQSDAPRDQSPAEQEMPSTTTTEDPLSCDDLVAARDCQANSSPVCAVIDTGVRCITVPCPSSEWRDFANACEACNSVDPDKILGYRKGRCPPPKH